jgi:hypothetical protein
MRSGGRRPASRRRVPASSVADITRMRRSGRSAPRASHVSARPRSALRERSWNSSKMTVPMPGRSGASCTMRVRMPSVTTSIRVVRDLRFAPDAVAHGSPARLAQHLGHAFGGGAGGEAARLQHHDAALGARVQQRQRHARRLARTRRRLQDGAPGRVQRPDQIGQDLVDGQRQGSISREVLHAAIDRRRAVKGQLPMHGPRGQSSPGWTGAVGCGQRRDAAGKTKVP